MLYYWKRFVKRISKNEIVKLNLNKNIKLVGFKNKAEHYLPESDIFVLSQNLKLPNVLIEQKYIPIISSNCPTGPS